MRAPWPEIEESTLADGAQLPLLGLGVWQAPNARERVDAVRWALQLGSRHTGTARAYGNEEGVGQGPRGSGVPREQVFTGVHAHQVPSRTQTRSQWLGAASSGSGPARRPGHRRLAEGRADWAWPGMGRAPELGHARWIGVSGFDVAELRQLLATASVAPVVDQVRFSPYECRKGLLDACRGDGVVLGASGPLGHGRRLGSETPTRIAQRLAQRLGRTPAQVLLRWCIEREAPLLAKSTHRDRTAGNAQLFDSTLSDADMAELDALDRTGGTQRAHQRKWW